jgi:hypothetical protein
MANARDADDLPNGGRGDRGRIAGGDQARGRRTRPSSDTGNDRQKEDVRAEWRRRETQVQLAANSATKATITRDSGVMDVSLVADLPNRDW